MVSSNANRAHEPRGLSLPYGAHSRYLSNKSLWLSLDDGWTLSIEAASLLWKPPSAPLTAFRESVMATDALFLMLISIDEKESMASMAGRSGSSSRPWRM